MDSTAIHSTTRSKLTVAVDLDEVLAAFVESLAEYHNEVYHTRFSAADFHSYRFADVWGGTEEETNKKLDDFFCSKYFQSDLGLTPLAAAADTLKHLISTERFRFVVVTARHTELADVTRRWLATHYDGIFEDIHFGNHFGAVGSKKRTKREICAEIGASVLIDDNVSYAIDAAGALPIVILFGMYSWNRSGDDGSVHSPLVGHVTAAPTSPTETLRLPSNVIRAVNWRHVGSILLRMRNKLDRRDAPGSGAITFNQWLGIREAITINSASAMPGAVTTPLAYADQVRRQLEVQRSIQVTGTGHDTRLVAEAADLLVRYNDAVITDIRTGADAAPPGKPRFPRLTIALTRSDTFLDRRFRRKAPVMSRSDLTEATEEAAEALSVSGKA